MHNPIYRDGSLATAVADCFLLNFDELVFGTNAFVLLNKH